jgi:hypothetical protein
MLVDFQNEVMRHAVEQEVRTVTLAFTPVDHPVMGLVLDTVNVQERFYCILLVFETLVPVYRVAGRTHPVHVQNILEMA